VEDIIARMNFKKDATAGGESLDDVPKEKLMEALSRRMR
jgi:hypothetical protein